MKKKIQYLLVLAGLLVFGITRFCFAEEYYYNNFEDKDDVSYWCCAGGSKAQKVQEQGYFTVNQKGIVFTNHGEKAYSGIGSFKLDITLHEKDEKYFWNYWKGPRMKVFLNKPVWLSGYIYAESIPPDVKIRLGWSTYGTATRGADKGKFIESCPRIEKMTEAEGGWIFFQANVSEVMKNLGFGDDTYIEFWYVSIRTVEASKKPFHGQRVVFYLDDVRISSEKIDKRGNLVVRKMEKRGDILTDEPYRVKYTSFFKDMPENPHNVVDNSSFELGMKNWEVFDSSGTRTNWQIDETTAFHGKRSLKICRPDVSSATGVYIRSQLVPIEDGKSYTLSFYAKSDNPTTIKTAGSSISLTNTWKRCVVPIHNIQPFISYGKKTSGYHSILMGSHGKGNLWLDAVQLEKGELTDYQLPSSVELGLSTNKMNNIFYPGEPVRLSVNVFNATGEIVSPAVSYKMTDFERKVIKQEELNLSLKNDEGKTEEIKYPFRKGYYKLSAILKDKGLAKKEAEISFGIISPLSNLKVDEDSFFGITCIGHSVGPNFDLVSSMYEEAGTKHGSIYGLLYWSGAPENWKEHNPQWNVADKSLLLMKKYNMSMGALLYGCPAWSGIKNIKPASPEQITDEVAQGWYDYNYEVVRRYKDRIKEWEVWAEFMPGNPDIQDMHAEMYMKFLKSAYEAIKKADPEAIVSACGDYAANNWSLIPKAEAHFKLGSLNYMDVVGLDCYSYPSSPEDVDYAGMIDRLNEVIKKYNNGKEKPIWVTEVGWKGLDTLYSDLPYDEGKVYTTFVTELAQAENIVRMNIISLAKGVKRFFTYSFGSGNIVKDHPYGLLNYGGSSPKSAYVAYNNMVNNLRGAEFEKEIKIGENIRCYQFNKENRPLIVIWNCDSSHKPIKINVKLGPKKLKITNMVGGRVSLQKEGKDTILTLTGSPLYIDGKRVRKSSFINAFKNAEVREKQKYTKELKGIRVGMYGPNDPFLTKPIKGHGAEVSVISELNKESLGSCDVILYPLTSRGLNKSEREIMREYVKGGGGVLLLHDAVGYRKHPVIFPEIGKGISNPLSKDCKIIIEHTVSKGFKTGDIFEHGYADHIQIEPGEKGKIVIREEDNPDKKPVVVIGQFGKGRVVLNGMAVGFISERGNYIGGKGIPPKEEQQILINCIKWLAEPDHLR